MSCQCLAGAKQNQGGIADPVIDQQLRIAQSFDIAQHQLARIAGAPGPALTEKPNGRGCQILHGSTLACFHGEIRIRLREYRLELRITHRGEFIACSLQVAAPGMPRRSW